MIEMLLFLTAVGCAFLAGLIYGRHPTRNVDLDDIAASAVVWAAAASFPSRSKWQSEYIEAVETTMRLVAELSPGSPLSEQTLADLQRMEGWQVKLVSHLLAEATRGIGLLMKP